MVAPQTLKAAADVVLFKAGEIPSYEPYFKDPLGPVKHWSEDEAKKLVTDTKVFPLVCHQIWESAVQWFH